MPQRHRAGCHARSVLSRHCSARTDTPVVLFSYLNRSCHGPSACTDAAAMQACCSRICRRGDPGLALLKPASGTAGRAHHARGARVRIAERGRFRHWSPAWAHRAARAASGAGANRRAAAADVHARGRLRRPHRACRAGRADGGGAARPSTLRCRWHAGSRGPGCFLCGAPWADREPPLDHRHRSAHCRRNTRRCCSSAGRALRTDAPVPAPPGWGRFVADGLLPGPTTGTTPEAGAQRGQHGRFHHPHGSPSAPA
jgi:hypothetical protein